MPLHTAHRIHTGHVSARGWRLALRALIAPGLAMLAGLAGCASSRESVSVRS
jgi:hypothetical protein